MTPHNEQVVERVWGEVCEQFACRVSGLELGALFRIVLEELLLMSPDGPLEPCESMIRHLAGRRRRRLDDQDLAIEIRTPSRRQLERSDYRGLHLVDAIVTCPALGSERYGLRHVSRFPTEEDPPDRENLLYAVGRLIGRFRRWRPRLDGRSPARTERPDYYSDAAVAAAYTYSQISRSVEPSSSCRTCGTSIPSRYVWGSELCRECYGKTIDPCKDCGGQSSLVRHPGGVCPACHERRRVHLQALDLLARIMRAVANAVTLRMAAALSLRGEVEFRIGVMRGGRRMASGLDAIAVCATHGLLDKAEQVIEVAAREESGLARARGECRACHDRRAAAASAVVWVFALMLECAHYLWESRGDLEKRVSLLEVSNEPPAPYRDSGRPSADEKSSQVDTEFGSGVVALQELLELD